jgi:hypothetical protein
MYGTYGGSTSYLSTNAGVSFSSTSLSGSNSGMLAYDRATFLAHQASSGVWKFSVAYTVPLSSTPAVLLLTPSGGEIWSVGTQQTIQWSSVNVTGNVKIELSRDGGGNYETVLASTSNDGAEGWTVSGATTSNALIRVSSVNNPSVFSQSSAPFIIASSTTTVHLVLSQGWNMLSLPLTVADRSTTSLFPTAISPAYAFTSGYVIRDTLEYGVGYWLKFPSVQDLSVEGAARTSDTIHVIQGWNLIGSISNPVPVGTIVEIPSGIVVSPYYGYGSGYVPTTSIEPMRGYWVKVNQMGSLVLSSSGAPSRVDSTGKDIQAPPPSSAAK